MLYSAEGGLRGSKLRYGEPFHLVTVGENTGKGNGHSQITVFCHCQKHSPAVHSRGHLELEGLHV